MEVPATTTATPTPPPKSAVDALGPATDTAVVVGIGIGFLALVCLIMVLCRRRRSDHQQRDHLHTKIWETATPGVSSEDVSVMEEANGKQHASYLFVPEQHGEWGVRSSNILAEDLARATHTKPHHSKNDIVLLEDDELLYLSGRHPPHHAAVPPTSQLHPIVLQPPVPTQPRQTRPRLSTEDDSEAGDVVDEELSLRRSSNSFAHEDDGGWSTNLSLVSEMSMLDSEHGDRMSTISFSSFDDDDDVTEAKI